MDCLISGEIRENTEKILKEISAEGMFSTKVLSTWKGSLEGKDIPTDWIILETEDPGPLCDGEEKARNVLRSATLGWHGIQVISGEYVFKGRTDIQITSSGYDRLIKYSADENLRQKLLFDSVGTTSEYFHISDFCLAGEANFLKDAFYTLHQRMAEKKNREHLFDLLENTSSQLFHKKRYETICPAETMNFIFAFYPGDFYKCKSLLELETSLSTISAKIDFFHLRDFHRGNRLDPRTGLKPLYRYLRGKVRVGGTLGALVDKFY